MPTRQTLRDYLVSIGSAATSISMPIDRGSDGVVGEGDDLGTEPNTERDLVNFGTGESLLGDYVSFVTQDNDYQIAPGAHEAVSTRRGAALATAETQGALNVFANSGIRDNALALDRSNSGQFDASGYPLNTIVDKTGGNDSVESENILLNSAVGASGNSDDAPNQSQAVVASFAMFKKYNRFSPTSDPAGFAIDESGYTITTDVYEADRPMRVQVGDGKYETESAEVSADISQETLSKVARSMILKAAGWDTSIFPNQATDPDKAFDDVGAGSLGKFPNIRDRNISTVDAFRAQDSYGMPVASNGEDSILSGRGDAVQKSIGEAVYTKTRGSSYTADQKFTDNPSNVTIQALQAGIAIVGLAALIDGSIAGNLNYIKELRVDHDSVLRGPYYLGSSQRSDLGAKTRALIKSFMFQTGIYSYSACVAEGLYSCFGFSSLNAGAIPVRFDTPDLARRYAREIENIANNASGPSFYTSGLGLSLGFWRAVSESAVRTISMLRDSAGSLNAADYVACLLGMPDSISVKVLNVFASIGYQRLIIQSISTREAKEEGGQVQNPYDMDAYPNAPGTRQMKSRDGELLSNASLAWRNSALPSMFILPIESMAATFDLDYMFDPDKGANPIKGMLGSTLYDKTYVKAVRNSNTIPPTVAKIVEDRLGAEYVPFYFRDLRTNEIVAFHAFLETLTDGYTAAFNGTKGFGRADPVQNYSSTDRTIGFSFWIVSTSKEDFDEMWFKINKLTTLVYPQYTRGRPVTGAKEALKPINLEQTITLEQPFSQLAGGTPVVRIRIGDLIKTNYTRSNFAKLFGVGNDTFGAKAAPGAIPSPDSFTSNYASISDAASATDVRLVPFLLAAASPMELISLIPQTSGLDQVGSEIAAEAAAYFMKNGFVNPILGALRDQFLRNEGGTLGLSNSIQDPTLSFIFSSNVLLKARSTPYIAKKDGRVANLRLRRPILVKVKEIVQENEQNRTGSAYRVEVTDSTVGEFETSEIVVSAADLYVDSGQILDVTSVTGAALLLGQLLGGGSSGIAGAAAGLVSSAISAGLQGADLGPVDIPLADFIGSAGRTFTSPYNNPITRAFEDKMGEGLAGVVKNLSFTWMDTGAWEMDWNSRAPTACKVNITFAPIHDIAPGLDSNGFNRAPIYNVGQIMHDSFGSPRADGGNASRYFYKKGGAIAENASNPEKTTAKIQGSIGNSFRIVGS